MEQEVEIGSLDLFPNQIVHMVWLMILSKTLVAEVYHQALHFPPLLLCHSLNKNQSNGTDAPNG